MMQSDRGSELWKWQKNTMTFAEIVGTGILLFIGCMGCIGSTVTYFTSAAANGTDLWFNSKSHNYGLKSIPTVRGLHSGPVYVGAAAGYDILKMITPAELFNDGNSNTTVGLCVTVVHPGISSVQAILFIEVLCTSCILCAACATRDPRCAHTTDSVALRFGLSVTAIFLAASPYTGCSMNPTRTFGPAFWNNAWKDQWIYWLGPCLGALLGTYAYQVLFVEKQLNWKEPASLSDEKP